MIHLVDLLSGFRIDANHVQFHLSKLGPQKKEDLQTPTAKRIEVKSVRPRFTEFRLKKEKIKPGVTDFCFVRPYTLLNDECPSPDLRQADFWFFTKDDVLEHWNIEGRFEGNKPHYILNRYHLSFSPHNYLV